MIFGGSYSPNLWAVDSLGLDEAYRRLKTLAANPDMLQRERHRFSISPPLPRDSPTFSTLSGDDPNWPQAILKPGEREGFEVRQEWNKSCVRDQFWAEEERENKRLHPETYSHWFLDFGKEAAEKVKADWRAQGIWDERWVDKYSLYGEVWKHERPLTDDEEEDDDENAHGETELLEPASECRPHRPALGLSSLQPPLSPPKPPTTKNKKTREAAEQDRDASRPFQRFIYLVSRERERILAAADSTGPDSTDPDATGPDATGPTTAPLDINTQAYTNVKADWVERGIWYRKWGQLPGMNWKHELPHDRDELWMEGYTPPPAPPGRELYVFRFTSPHPDSSRHIEKLRQKAAELNPPEANSPGGTQKVNRFYRPPPLPFFGMRTPDPDSLGISQEVADFFRTSPPISGMDAPQAYSPGGTREVAGPPGNSPLVIPSEVPRRLGHSSPAEVYSTIETPDEVSVSIAKLPTSPAILPDPEQGPRRAGGSRSSLRSRKLDMVVSGSISKASKGRRPAGRRTRSRKTPVFVAEVQDQAKTRRSARLQALNLKMPQSMPTRDVGNSKSVAESQEMNKQQRTTRGKGRKL